MAARQEVNGGLESRWLSASESGIAKPVLCTPFIGILARAVAGVVVRRCGAKLGLVEAEPEFLEEDLKALGSTATAKELMELRGTYLKAS